TTGKARNAFRKQNTNCQADFKKRPIDCRIFIISPPRIKMGVYFGNMISDSVEKRKAQSSTSGAPHRNFMLHCPGYMPGRGGSMEQLAPYFAALSPKAQNPVKVCP